MFFSKEKARDSFDKLGDHDRNKYNCFLFSEGHSSILLVSSFVCLERLCEHYDLLKIYPIKIAPGGDFGKHMPSYYFVVWHGGQLSGDPYSLLVKQQLKKSSVKESMVKA